MRIELQNKKTKEVITFDNISDLNNGEKLFYKFSINASSLEDGEYGLSLFDGDNLIATDTLCVGDFDVNGLQYKKGESIYIENILNTKIEDKVVSVNDIKTTVLPTEGYDAMATVGVNAQPVYDKGYFDGAKSATQNTDVLNITENGFYPTQYSNIDEIPESYITGYNEDETPFYSYARLKDRGYKIEVRKKNPDIELWWKPDLTNREKDVSTSYSLCRPLDEGNGVYLYFDGGDGNLKINAMYNGKEYKFEEILEDKWYHIILSYPEGFVVNGVKIADIPLVTPTYQKSDYYINVAYSSYRGEYFYMAGYYGMVKVDGNVYIPTENGFIQTPNEPLDIFREGEYQYTSPIPPFEGNLVRTINVDVKPKISIAKEQIKLAFGTFKKVPEWADFSEGVTDISNMFYYCTQIETVPFFDTSRATSAQSMFANCGFLKTIPQYDTNKCTNFSQMFYSCQRLEYVPLLDGSSAENPDLFYFTSCVNLTYFGGLKNIKVDWNSYGAPYQCPNLTYESVISILSNLYDFRGNGDSSTTRTIKLHSNHMAMLSDDDKAIATNKGWIITT